MSIRTRFSSIVHKNIPNQRLHIFGCGAIGSNVAIHLEKMGVSKFNLYDYDEVEQANIGVTPYTTRDIGKKKVDALSSILGAYCDVNVFKEEIKDDTNIKDIKGSIAILAFDNMKARMIVAKKICKENPKLLIDGRMGAQLFQMYVLQKPKLKDYIDLWYSDEEGSEEPCTAKATPWCSTLTGSFISNAVSKVISGHPCPKELFFNFPDMTLSWEK